MLNPHPTQQFPPVTTLPHPEIFEKMGQEGIDRLLISVYHKLAKSPISALFPSDPEELEKAARKSALFFVGICGGPPLYQMEYGHPRMRDRHMKFPIDEPARQAWVACWDETLDTEAESLGFPVQHRDGMKEYLHTFSHWMVNR